MYEIFWRETAIYEDANKGMAAYGYGRAVPGTGYWVMIQ